MKAKIFLCLWMIFFIACSDDSISFNANDAEAVSVKAYFSRLGDSTNTRVKADTILPTDSILLIALIEPSRSIRMENFYWQIDNGKKFSEFSHRTLVSQSGMHVAKFVLLDRFADTLSDSVTFWTAPIPVLDLENFIPRNGSEISANAKISFAWNALETNPFAETNYHFSLRCGKKILADTILSSPQFSPKFSLPSLENCTWEVYAQDDFARVSFDTLRANFVTESADSSSRGATLFRIQSALSQNEKFEFQLWNSKKEIISADSLLIDWDNSLLTMKNLPAGNYRIFFRHEKFHDYQSDTISFAVKSRQISSYAISIQDTIKPYILCNDCENNTFLFRDTLKFSIIENDPAISPKKIRVVIDGEAYSAWEILNDTLQIFTAEISPALISHPITISVTDQAGNFSKEQFSLSPKNLCVQTFSDTLVEKNTTLKIPIQNACPHLTPKRFFWDIDGDGSWDGEAAADGKQSAEKTFSGSLFQNPEMTIRVYIQYESGARFENHFTLYVNGVSG